MAKVIFQNLPANEMVSAELFAQLFTNNDTIGRGLATAREGIKHKERLRTINENIKFQDPSCEFTPPNSAPTIDSRTLEVLAYSFQRQLCFDDLKNVIASTESLRGGTLNDYLGTPELLEAIMNFYGERIASANNKLYWLGANAVGEFSNMSIAFKNSYLGLLPTMIADNDVVAVTLPNLLTIANAGIALATPNPNSVVVTHGAGENANVKIGDFLTFSDNVGGTIQIRGLTGRVTAKTPTTTTLDMGVPTGAFTAHTTGGLVRGVIQANVIEVMQAVYDATPESVKASGTARMYVSGKIADLYAYTQASAGGNGVDSRFFVGAKQLDFLGVPVERMPDWLPNVILMARPENLFVGFDSQDDENSMDIKWLGETTMDYVYGIRCEMKSGVQYAFSKEITIIKPALV